MTVGPGASAVPAPGPGMPLQVPVAVSATHVHLTAAAIEALFGDYYRLHEHHRLVQPSLYEAHETVTLTGPHGALTNVQVIGPARSENQVEVSFADASALGIRAPVRRSGDIAATPGISIRGPRTTMRLERGVIRALRHIHMTPADSERIGVKDGDHVEAVIPHRHPPMALRDLLVRVSPDSRLELHLDTQEANTFNLHSGDHVELVTAH